MSSTTTCFGGCKNMKVLGCEKLNNQNNNPESDTSALRRINPPDERRCLLSPHKNVTATVFKYRSHVFSV
ncbi:hypothetical protein CDAR_75221, partial [Caerostris darwini]